VSRFAVRSWSDTRGSFSTCTPRTWRQRPSPGGRGAAANLGRAARGDLDALLDAGVADQHTREAMDFDLFPYGVIANRELLETATLYSFEQGLVPRRLELAELFYPPTLEL